VEGTLDVSKVNEIPLEFVGEQAVDPAFYVQRGAGLPRIPPRKPYVDEDD
jgi:hypothetical protein